MVRIFIVLTAFMFQNRMPVRTIPMTANDCLALLFYASVPSFHSVCPSCEIPIFGAGISPIVDCFISITITVLSKFIARNSSVNKYVFISFVVINHRRNNLLDEWCIRKLFFNFILVVIKYVMGVG